MKRILLHSFCFLGEVMEPSGIYRYWGKTGEDGSYHLQPYHCLDVAAVNGHQVGG